MKRGLLIAPLAGLLFYFLPLPLTTEGHRMLAITAVATTLWISEAIPLAATALLIAVLVVLFGVAPPAEVFSVFAEPILFLFVGSFMIAEAMQIHKLDQRIASAVLQNDWVRAKTSRITFLYACICFFISMWISNTATTAMMFPIGLSIIRVIPEDGRSKVAQLVLLMTSFGASIGGIATPVGTPPNLIGIGMIKNILNRSVPFFEWMSYAFPISVLTFLAIYFFMRLFLAHDCMKQPMQKIDLPPDEPQMRKAQRNVMIAFLITVFLWLLPGFVLIFGGESKWWENHLPESVAALIGAILLFILPVDWKNRKFTITWKQAEGINWGIILLFGGGLILGKFLFKTGVAQYFGDSIAAIYPFRSEFSFILLFTLLAVFISEFTSNTASANMILPVSIAVCQSAGIDPYRTAIAATLASSLGFMLPISTAPNAIVFSSGMIPIRSMIRNGIVLDIVGALIVAIGMYLLA
jgi:sodium-dependent dicarboxylate transporter 2/3/5